MHRVLIVTAMVLWCIGGEAQCWQYVDPRIGSVGVGRTFPGPSMPFGKVKPGPDCGVLPNAGWAPMPEAVAGFSQTHVSGTGGGQKYGNILLQPFVDSGTQYSQPPQLPQLPQPPQLPQKPQLPQEPQLPQPLQSSSRVAIPQQRVTETIALGYYSTTYSDGVTTEITTSERCAHYRFHYPTANSQPPNANRLLIDATHFLGKDTVPNLRERQQLVAAALELTAPQELTGFSTVRGGWNNGAPYTVFFCLLSDKPFEAMTLTDAKAVLLFADTLVNVKIGISYVSTDQARRNIDIHGFDRQLSLLRSAWEEQLQKVSIEGTDEQKRMFYTALYHTMLMPVCKTGEYPVNEAEPQKENGRDTGKAWTYYDDYYAIWDTYRTSSPLITILDPQRETDIVNALINIYVREGYLPDARSGDCNGRTQGGSNAEVVIADAFVKHLPGIDYELALKAMLKDGEEDPGADHEKHGRGGLDQYLRLGYIPYGIPRAGTRTVEYAFDDYCISVVARGLGHENTARRYEERSKNWRNLWRSDYEWDGMRGYVMPKDEEGRWLDSVVWGQSAVFKPMIPYTPVTKVAPWYIPWWDTFFYEATSQEYSLSVPHDVEGLIEACGGEETFRKRLDRFFERGYYNVQNEPSFLTPCLYHWIGRPDLSTRRIHEIVNNHYSDKPDGLPGNDDSGAMSSWLAFHMMGLYPNAGHDYYLLNVPLLPEYTLHLANGKSLHVQRKGNGNGFGSVTFNGRELTNARITHDELMEGGNLLFTTAADETVRGELHFTLNRQFRTWPYSCHWDGDTLTVICKQTTYRIPRKVVEEGSGFCWLSPQTDGTIYNNVEGTMGFISMKAMRQLEEQGFFVYDGMTWRRQEQPNAPPLHPSPSHPSPGQLSPGQPPFVCSAVYPPRPQLPILVKADIDGTLMLIDPSQPLPFVTSMSGNKLGIDWTMIFE